MNQTNGSQSRQEQLLERIYNTLNKPGASADSVRITDGTDTVDILDLTNNNPLAVAIVDGTGDQITSFGGGTQYAEGTVAATITGTATLMEVAGNTVQPIQGSVADGLLVNLGTNNDVTVTSGTITAVTSITNALPAGTNNIGDVDVLSIIPGVGATNLGKAEDAVHTSGDTGVMALVVRTDTPAAIAGTTGDYTPLISDASGRLHVNNSGINGITVLTGNGVTGTGSQRVTIASDNTAFTVNLGTSAVSATALGKAEDAVHASGDTGVMSLAVRQDTQATLVSATGDYSPLTVDAVGRLRISTGNNTTATSSNVTASITNVTILASNANRRGATIYNDSTSLVYLKLGATATSTSFTLKLQPDSYYEVPFDYSGIIDGIWVAANGAARVVEITA